jgi:hypothetical protein
MPPRSKASDYAKGKITQDEIIALQIANDANIAAARKAVKMGIVQPLNPLLSASPDELLADDSAQEAMARTNLERIGFRPQEAAQIIADIRSDPVLDFTSLNANFPAIEADIKKRFNVKLLTPSFFMNYLSQYKIELDLSRGLGTTGGLSNLVNSIGEIIEVLPSQAQMGQLVARIVASSRNTTQRNLLTPILERIRVLQDALPNPAEYRRIDQLDPVDRQRIIQELQTATADLPSKAQIDALIQQTSGGISSGSVQSLSALANSVPPELQRNLDAIMREIREVGDIQSEITQNIEYMRRQQQQPSGQTGKVERVKQTDWDEITLILNETDWNTLNRLGKSKFLRSRKDLGEELLDNPTKTYLAQNASVSELNDIFNKWLEDYGYALAGSMSSSGSAPYNPASSIVSSSTFAPSQVSNITPTGVAETFQSTSGKQGKGVGNQGFPTTLPFRGINYKKEGVRGNVVPSKIGKGVSVKETPSYREYGKYAIHIPQLEQQDMLNVKYKSLGQIPKFKPVPVSDIFRDFIIDLLDNGKPNARVYTQIAPNERKFFEEMSIGAGVWNGLGLKRTTTSTDEEENKRFELLKGEYLAGNNNPKVISELRRLVVKMMSDGRIRKSQGIDLLMELSI